MANVSGTSQDDEHQGDLTSDDKDRLLEVWKKAVDTQMHFNEMSGKSRQLGLTFVAAALGVAVVLLSRGDDFAISAWGWKLHVGVMLVLAAALALWGVRRLDLSVYHRMLRGAVTFGEDFERNYMSKIFTLEKGMTQAISHYSRFSDADVDKSGPAYVYSGNKKITAEKKIREFYRDTILFLLLSAVLLSVVTNLGNVALSDTEAAPPSGLAQEGEADQGASQLPQDNQ